MNTERITVDTIRRAKREGRRLTMLTAYDRPTAAAVDAGGVDIVLVGDTLAMVVLGLPTTRHATMDLILASAAAVSRGVQGALVVVDLPYETLAGGLARTRRDARRCVDEAGAHAVKAEWRDDLPATVRALVADGIPVMGHVGLTPQAVSESSGFRVQGTSAVSAAAIVHSAAEMEAAGCFSLVVECVPENVARLITTRLTIPTIGIGAGPDCDGQVLVLHDLLGLSGSVHPKFVRRYADVSSTISEAVVAFRSDVERRAFPSQRESYHMNADEAVRLEQLVAARANPDGCVPPC